MNIADVYIVAIALAALPLGAVVGGMLQTGFLGGFAGGLALGTGASMVFSGLPHGGARGVLVLFLIFGMASGLAAVGFLGGVRARNALRQSGLNKLDAGFGVVVAGFVALFGSWLLSAPLAVGSEGYLARQIQESSVVAALDRGLPPPATLFGRVWGVMGVDPVAPVYAQMEPADAEAVSLPSEEELAGAVDAAEGSTVRVVADDCSEGQEGSGFVVAPDLVVASGHVVAGTDTPVVEDGEGAEHRTKPVAFDRALDLAVLRAPELAGDPLSLSSEGVSRGTTGAILGYPAGVFDAHPAAVLERATVLAPGTPDGPVERDVYQLRAHVHPGASGGPLVNQEGTVLGVVFSRSLVDDELGYALTSPAVAEAVAQAGDKTERVDTGECDSTRPRGQPK